MAGTTCLVEIRHSDLILERCNQHKQGCHGKPTSAMSLKNYVTLWQETSVRVPDPPAVNCIRSALPEAAHSPAAMKVERTVPAGTPSPVSSSLI